jgi:protein arginine kinase
VKKKEEFKLESLLTQTGEWLKGTGPESDVVMSTRVRLARNLSRFRFLTTATPAMRQEIEGFVRDRVLSAELPKKVHYLALHEMDPLDRVLLVERHLISRELEKSEGERGVAVAADETLSVMVNEEDHLRIQMIRSGLQPTEAWTDLAAFDDVLESRLSYGFHPKYGYVTCCPTNLGTGLRVSVMLHLPALVMSKQVEKVLQSLQKVNYNIRGFFGEGTSPSGDFFQVSNQGSLGRSETKIVEEMNSTIPEIARVERGLREKLFREQRSRVEDRVWRAYATLKYARSVTSEETLELLSCLRMGIGMGVLTNIPLSIVNEIFIHAQPGHLQKLHNKPIPPPLRDVLRADMIREKLKSV